MRTPTLVPVPALALTFALALSLSAPAATSLRAQTPALNAADAPDAPAAFCWRGRALPACRAFALFELEGALAVASTTMVHESPTLTTDYPAFEHEVKWHLGAMRNVSRTWALGGAVSVGSGSSGALTGIRLRARRWLNPPVSAEFEAGAVDTDLNERFGSGIGWGPTVGARLNAADYVSIFTRWEGGWAEAGTDEPFRREAGFHQGLYVGASAGSTPAAAGTAVLGALALWVVATLAQGDF